MNAFYTFDQRFISFCRKYYSVVARVALFVIYFYFGFLKLIGLSPADELARNFAGKMGAGAIFPELFIGLAALECLIGLLFLFPKLTRVAIFIMLLHMVLVCAPLILDVSAVWSGLLIPNLEGQYIIKNAALVALALGLVAQTQPLTTSRKKR
jgi:uncharacterized membrane protein YphA (DoxX/SURF4 family)